MQEKRAFERHEDEEMEILIYDYQHVDENFERHEVEMLTPFVDKNKQENKNMAYKGINAFIITLLLTVYRNISGYLSSRKAWSNIALYRF